MGSYKQREERKALLLFARMRADAGWRDVTVCNVSSRGMMLRCEAPPGRNTFIEIRHQKACVVGRVIWSKGNSFGINTQAKIDLQQLLSQHAPPARGADVERRASPRHETRSVEMRLRTLEGQSRAFAALFDWIVVALGLAFSATFVADLASDALEAPLEKVRYAMISEPENGHNYP